MGSPRIEELRRRVEKDPASIAFAQLAEEYRRAGDYEQAILVCRAGLEHHPGYLSARVTLGRALLETGQYDEAQEQLDRVIAAAPDNLAAIRTRAELHQRRADEIDDVRDPGLGTRDPGAATAPEAAPSSEVVPNPEPASSPESRVPSPDSPQLRELESWLAAILADRAQRGDRAY